MTEDQFAALMHAAVRREGKIGLVPKNAGERHCGMTAAQAARARSFLLDGYGVEDIAVRLKITVKFVRAWLADLRGSGDLARIYAARKAIL